MKRVYSQTNIKHPKTLYSTTLTRKIIQQKKCSKKLKQVILKTLRQQFDIINSLQKQRMIQQCFFQRIKMRDPQKNYSVFLQWNKFTKSLEKEYHLRQNAQNIKSYPKNNYLSKSQVNISNNKKWVAENNLLNQLRNNICDDGANIFMNVDNRYGFRQLFDD